MLPGVFICLKISRGRAAKPRGGSAPFLFASFPAGTTPLRADFPFDLNEAPGQTGASFRNLP